MKWNGWSDCVPRFNHIIVFVLVRTIYFMFEMLPLRFASGLGGFLARNIGPILPVTQVARQNLQRILPQRAADHGRIIRQMWDNFGRLFAEYPHLKAIAAQQKGAQIDIVGEENFTAFRDMARGGLVVTGHLANWEFGTYLARMRGVPMHVVYRPPNNPLVDRLLASARSGGAVSSIAKGTDGAKDIIRLLKNKEFLALLVDQKMNDGVALDFMGAPAMTAAAAAQLAIKFQVPIVMVRPQRLRGLHFRWTVLPPLIPSPDADARVLMQQINDQLSEWVRECPHEWLWIHRRWKN
jgi:KDO2-lipid IV(A) lauroyltransferase